VPVSLHESFGRIWWTCYPTVYHTNRFDAWVDSQGREQNAAYNYWLDAAKHSKDLGFAGMALLSVNILRDLLNEG
jgi:hypothetical protein